jgi:uncharacterized caspase-like protein
MATRQLKHFLFLACLVLATKAETQELIFCAGLDPDFAIHDRTKDIKENLLEGAHKLRLVILDACRDNPFAQRVASLGGTRSVGRGLARVEPRGGVLVAYSARDGHLAQDGDEANSPFAQALVQHLEEPGVEISLLFRKVAGTTWIRLMPNLVRSR